MAARAGSARRIARSPRRSRAVAVVECGGHRLRRHAVLHRRAIPSRPSRSRPPRRCWLDWRDRSGSWRWCRVAPSSSSVAGSQRPAPTCASSASMGSSGSRTDRSSPPPGPTSGVSQVAEVVDAGARRGPRPVSGSRTRRCRLRSTGARRPMRGPWAHDFAARWAERTGSGGAQLENGHRLPPAPGGGQGHGADVVGGAAVRRPVSPATTPGTWPPLPRSTRWRQDGMTAVRIAVADAESPPALVEAADLVVAGPERGRRRCSSAWRSRPRPRSTAAAR